MSVRVLLSVVVALALAALLVAALAIFAALRSRDAELLRRAEDSSVAATEGLVRAYRRLPQEPRGEPGGARELALRRAAALVLEPVWETRGGYCWPDGHLVQEDSASMHPSDGAEGPHGPPAPAAGPGWEGPPRRSRHHPPGPETVSPPPPPDVARVLERECARLASGQVARAHLQRGHHTNIVVVMGMGGAAAFTSRIVSRPVPDGPSWTAQILVMALITLAMVGATRATSAALRGGARDLDGVLAGLERDLRADTARPRTREFAAIAERVRSLAASLAEARDRERTLARQVAHKDRLSVLGRAAAGVAHEIRNPLTGIKLLLDGMLRRGMDARTHDEVEACLEEIGRLDHVVGALLGVARDPRAASEPIELGALVDQRTALLAPHAAGRGVEVARTGEAELRGERAPLVQVVDNLVRNAIDASARGQRVTVQVGEQDGFVTIDVVDQGPGVPANIAGELFEPFASGKDNGTGLGLWLSQTLASSRGGELSYHRQCGETHFMVTWPRSPADESPPYPGRR